MSPIRDAHPPTCSRPDVQHIGVVMVHGVGFQRAGDTLLTWSRALERALEGWTSSRTATVPTVAAQVGLDPGDERLVEIQLHERSSEAAGAGGGELHILITEALWSPYLREPSTHEVSTWLGERGAAGRLAEGVLGLRASGNASPGQSNIYKDAAAQPDQAPTLSAVAALRARLRQAGGSPRQALNDGTRSLLLGFNRLRVAVVASGFASILLLLWAALRAITSLLPFIGGLTGRVDHLLTGLAGDMHTLLNDPAQAANVRSRVGIAIEALRGFGCDRVMLVAHSAGAVASYMTMNDPAYRHVPIDGLITFGQGLNAAWALTDAYSTSGCAEAARTQELIIRDPRTDRRFVWHDYWASDDPIPVGSIRFPVCSGGHVDVDGGPIWNRASSGSDHSLYWSNDEEFVMPVLAEVVALASEPNGGKINGRAGRPIEWRHRSALVERRRRRVSLLALWRRLAFIALPIAVVIGFTRPHFGGFDDLGLVVTRFWNALPLHELISGPVAAYQAWWVEALAVSELANAVIFVGGVVFIAVASVIGASVAIPFGRWSAWASSPRLASGLRWFDIGAGLSLFVVSAIAVGAVFVLPLILVLLGSAATLVAQRTWERMAGKRTQQMWVLSIVYLVGFSAFTVSWAAAFAIPLAGRLLLGIGVLYAVLLAVRGVGGWLWEGWDRYERQIATRDEVPAGEGWFIAGEGLALLGALAAIVLAVGFGAETPLGSTLPVAASLAALGLVITVVLTAAARASLRTT